ncbi:hypothetical protein CRI93_08885 [Longimonas halophila]|uniref:TonB C-terminal domain-containing protein n=1 Tax=Longimonas halophila TaxID=1469170 RepID=A0A2H3P509_9BACT|nr:energy transducer TonB [Longimonas halophila]PEN06742.1 hypothetical protein CRI93_08885 [Longimonas halophila]
MISSFPVASKWMFLSFLMATVVAVAGCAGSGGVRSDVPASCRPDDYNENRAEAESDEEECTDCQEPELIGGMASMYDKLSYPTKAREIGAEGTSWIQFILSREGEPTEVRVCQTAGNSILDREAWEAVRQLAFRPGMRAGEPVEVQMTLPVNFSLNR